LVKGEKRRGGTKREEREGSQDQPCAGFPPAKKTQRLRRGRGEGSSRFTTRKSTSKMTIGVLVFEILQGGFWFHDRVSITKEKETNNPVATHGGRHEKAAARTPFFFFF
jgi:hypothetical protein